jgi:hypothetical protein
MAAAQEARVAEITLALRESAPGKHVTGDARRALVDELNELLASAAGAADGGAMPMSDAESGALAGAAATLNRALYSQRWSGPDRAVLAGALSDVLMRMPDGAWQPSVLSGIDLVAGPVGILPAAIAQRLGDHTLSAEDRAAAITDLTNALTGPPGDPGDGAA